MSNETYTMDESVSVYLKTLNILCVDDNIITQSIYKNIFHKSTKKLFYAYNGEDGYNQYLNNNIDMIITDYAMPKLDGLIMIEKIRALDKNIPIILVSIIEDLDIITKALRLNVNNFLKKPILTNDLMQAIENTTKLLIADKYLQEQRNKQLKNLKKKDKYHSYQEKLAFLKELNILKNDFYYQMIDMECTALIDFFYKPLDIVSGDAYSVRKIDQYTTLYLIVDGMGKGLSASLSSLLVTSFINYNINTMLKENCFDLYKLIDSSLEYIKPIILDEEALAIDFITLNSTKNEMQYAKFAMPSILLQTKDDEIIRLKSNNQPISRYISKFKVSSYDTTDINKFLFYSDGVIENSTVYDSKLYAEFIENDFLLSYTKEDMKNKLLRTIYKQEDDITFIFLNKITLRDSLIENKVFESSLDTLELANDWYSDIWSGLCDDCKLIYNASIVFTELFMNAFEHGSLGLDADTKHKLISENIYFETIEKKQINCNKKITVSIYKIIYSSCTYILTQISDQGVGFNTNTLSKIFRSTVSFNGRGVYVSKNSSDGIYYNKDGNTVLYIHKINNTQD